MNKKEKYQITTNELEEAINSLDNVLQVMPKDETKKLNKLLEIIGELSLIHEQVKLLRDTA